MKIPTNIFWNTSDSQKMIELWQNKAREISMRTGLFIQVGIEYQSESLINPRPIRIYFDALDHEWESLQDLESALKLKAFA